MYPLHKLECLAFRRTSHRYLDFRSKQHSSSWGFPPWPPFYGRVISCILPKKSLDNLFHLNGFTNSIEAALELLASFQSSGLWQHNCNPAAALISREKIDPWRKVLIKRRQNLIACRNFLLQRKNLNERRKNLNSVWKISSIRCSLNFYLYLENACLSKSVLDDPRSAAVSKKLLL